MVGLQKLSDKDAKNMAFYAQKRTKTSKSAFDKQKKIVYDSAMFKVERRIRRSIFRIRGHCTFPVFLYRLPARKGRKVEVHDE